MDSSKKVVKGLNICSINICGMSDRSRLTLDKYASDHQLDIIAIQETGTDDKDRLSLTNMEVITDSNKSFNKTN